MSEHHFVRDYERHVDHLTANHPLDEAMSIAVGGGDYEQTGLLLARISRHFGLLDGMRIVDFGCGSGRLAQALSRSAEVEYVGVDVVRPLLEYAAAKCPPHYRFLLNRKLSFPLGPQTCDFITAFSVFTHLHPPESYIYLWGMSLALKPGGRIVFSFLDVDEPEHWPEFKSTALHTAKGTLPTLNAFIARSWIEVWARELELEVEHLVAPREAPWGGRPLGHALAVLRKPG